MPASGCRPTLANAAAPSGIEDQVAGVGGDAREDADEASRMNASEPLRRRPRPACGSARAIRPAASATPAPIIATNVTATTPKPAKFGDERGEDEPDALDGRAGSGSGSSTVSISKWSSYGSCAPGLDARLGRVLVVVGRDGLRRPARRSRR